MITFTKKDEYIVFAVKQLKMNLLKRWKTIENESAWLKFDWEYNKKAKFDQWREKKGENSA